jgi:hypothetical protein
VPAVIAAGSAGGTVMVIRSKERSNISSNGSFYSSMFGRVERKPKIAIALITKINFKESS